MTTLLTEAEADRLIQLVQRHVDAEVAASWAGTEEPNHREVLHMEAKIALADLNAWLNNHRQRGR